MIIEATYFEIEIIAVDRTNPEHEAYWNEDFFEKKTEYRGYVFDFVDISSTMRLNSKLGETDDKYGAFDTPHVRMLVEIGDHWEIRTVLENRVIVSDKSAREFIRKQWN